MNFFLILLIRDIFCSSFFFFFQIMECYIYQFLHENNDIVTQDWKIILSIYHWCIMLVSTYFKSLILVVILFCRKINFYY